VEEKQKQKDERNHRKEENRSLTCMPKRDPSNMPGACVDWATKNAWRVALQQKGEKREQGGSYVRIRVRKYHLPRSLGGGVGEQFGWLVPLLVWFP
jgi:hypothetical protein